MGDLAVAKGRGNNIKFFPHSDYSSFMLKCFFMEPKMLLMLLTSKVSFYVL